MKHVEKDLTMVLGIKIDPEDAKSSLVRAGLTFYHQAR